jgi:hypothetical protein
LEELVSRLSIVEVPAMDDLSERIRRYIMVKTPLESADLAFVFGTRHGIESFAPRQFTGV